MIDFLKNWVLNIVTLVILILLLEILIPSSKMKKFVNLFSGLILIIAIINPFLGLMKKGIDFKDLQIVNSDFLDKKEIEQDSNVLGEQQMKEISETYRKKIIGQLEESAKEVGGISGVKADVIINEDYSSSSFGELKRVYLTLQTKTQTSNINPVVKVEKVEIDNSTKEPTETKFLEVDSKIKKQLEDKISSTFQINKENIIIQRENLK